MTIMKKEDFDKMWLSLPETLKIKRLKRAHNYLRFAYTRQLAVIKKIEEEAKIRDVYFVYVFRTVENFWDNVNLAYLMGKKNSLKNFAFHPARIVIETYLRFNYFSDLSDTDKDMVANKEILRIYFMLYKKELRDNNSFEADKMRKNYDNIREESDIPDIDKVKKKMLDPFPDMKSLALKSKVRDPENYYMIYEFLCEATHGKTISVIMRGQSKEFEEYRRSLMIIIDASKNMLILIDDNYCSSTLKKIILETISSIDKVIMGPLSKKEEEYLKK